MVGFAGASFTDVTNRLLSEEPKQEDNPRIESSGIIRTTRLSLPNELTSVFASSREKFSAIRS
jgi:hypothetical protein